MMLGKRMKSSSSNEAGRGVVLRLRGLLIVFEFIRVRAMIQSEPHPIMSSTCGV